MDKFLAYVVYYATKDFIFYPYGDIVKGFWSKETLAKRLLDFHYYVQSATLVILDDDKDII